METNCQADPDKFKRFTDILVKGVGTDNIQSLYQEFGKQWCLSVPVKTVLLNTIQMQVIDYSELLNQAKFYRKSDFDHIENTLTKSGPLAHNSTGPAITWARHSPSHILFGEILCIDKWLPLSSLDSEEQLFYRLKYKYVDF